MVYGQHFGWRTPRYMYAPGGDMLTSIEPFGRGDPQSNGLTKPEGSADGVRAACWVVHTGLGYMYALCGDMLMSTKPFETGDSQSNGLTKPEGSSSGGKTGGCSGEEDGGLGGILPLHAS
jgi:hypothetical protein